MRERLGGACYQRSSAAHGSKPCGLPSLGRGPFADILSHLCLGAGLYPPPPADRGRRGQGGPVSGVSTHTGLSKQSKSWHCQASSFPKGHVLQ